MAHLYKRGRQCWISYYVRGDLVQKSPKTTNERVARSATSQKTKRLPVSLSRCWRAPWPQVLASA
jgi:hypothetical protein